MMPNSITASNRNGATFLRVGVCVRAFGRVVLTIGGWDDNGPHELGSSGILTLSVQHGAAGANLPGSVVDDVIGVCWTDAIHNCPILSIISVQGQHLGKEWKRKINGQHGGKNTVLTHWPRAKSNHRNLTYLKGMMGDLFARRHSTMLSSSFTVTFLKRRSLPKR